MVSIFFLYDNAWEYLLKIKGHVQGIIHSNAHTYSNPGTNLKPKISCFFAKVAVKFHISVT
uniref:Uncharacterized protein n=1 Tax=Arundo donax TaxID=35708 RepID=A0A0A9GB74_ARUDO